MARLEVRLKPEQKERLVRFAKLSNLSVAAYVVKLIALGYIYQEGKK